MISYSKFASNISFFEFVQEEFHKAHFNVENYRKELEILKKHQSIESLAENLKIFPKIFDVAEEYFQLKRFTNTQYTHFLFDISKLNMPDLNKLLRYAEVSIFKFEDGNVNKTFKDLISENYNNQDIETKATGIKRAVVEYIAYLLKKSHKEKLYEHIQHSISTRMRISSYLIENFHADEHFLNINITKYLLLKREPKDTKGIHGKFGILKIKDILSKNSIINLDRKLKSGALDLASCSDPSIKKIKFSYVTERQILEVEKRNSRKPKKFDFVILKYGIPTYCIETNFYSTTGTKIGINIGEYTDLLEDIDKLNNQRRSDLKFIWITDGNHWLTQEGEKNYINLKTFHFKNDWQLLNYNLFSQEIADIIN